MVKLKCYGPFMNLFFLLCCFCQFTSYLRVCVFYLGMEVASYLTNKASSVAIVGTTKYPYEHSLGSQIGHMTMQVRNNGERTATATMVVIATILQHLVL